MAVPPETTFFRENWLALLSLAVAMIGGVPGVLSALEHRRKRPIFRASIAGIISGTLVAPPPFPPQTMVLFSMTLGNEGETPIVPGMVNCDLRMNGRWYKLQPVLIPPDAKFSGPHQIDLGDAAAQDLQRQRITLTQSTPATGLLMYSSREFTQDQFINGERTKARFKSIDLLGREHTADAPLTPEKVTGSVIYPKHDMKVFIPPAGS